MILVWKVYLLQGKSRDGSSYTLLVYSTTIWTYGKKAGLRLEVKGEIVPGYAMPRLGS